MSEVESQPVEVAPEVEPVKEEPKVLKLKVNNKEHDLDLTDKERIKYLAQMGLASDEKFKEASSMRKQAEEILEALKNPSDVVKVLQKAGMSAKQIREFSENFLRPIYEEEELAPEEKERRKEKKELEELRKEREERAKAEKQQQEEQLIAKEMQKLEEELIDAYAQSKLPKDNPFYAKAVLSYMDAAARVGQEMSAKEAVKLVEKDFDNQLKQLLSAKDVTELKSLLGEKAGALIKDSLEEVKTKEAPFKKPNQASPELPKTRQEPVKQYIKDDSFFRRF